MGKLTRVFTILLIAFTAILFINFAGFSSAETAANNLSALSPVNKSIYKKKLVYKFENIELFEFSDSYSDNSVNNAGLLNLNTNALRNLFDNRPENITLKIPFTSDKDVYLELTSEKVLTDDFSLGLITSQGINYVPYNDGVHYYGIIAGSDNSVVSISIFKNYVMGIISDNSGNYNLAPLKNSSSNKYILYNDNSLKIKQPFNCGVNDYDPSFAPNKKIQYQPGNDNSGGIANIYFECDYRMYQDFSSNTDSVMNYLTGFFNSVKTLYQNESVPVLISQVFIWTTQDPYLQYTTTLRILKRFSHERQNNFNGHLAHLISTRTPNLGGIAYLDVLCYQYLPSDSIGPTGFSSIFTTYENFPAWSYTVQVVAHELGHNFASKHTHACVWPLPLGGTGALDSCYAVEGNCYSGPPIARVGTVMSYCIFVTGGSINFNLGFGPRPGDTIRAAFQNAPCVIGIQNISSEIPSGFTLQQNYPNPFNPVTNIRFQVPEKTIVKLTVFDVNGREVEVLINEYLSPGTYNFDWDTGESSSGIYFYTLKSNNFIETKKMILIK